MSLSTQSFFDWYQATISDRDDEEVAWALALAFRGSLVSGKARLGYAVAHEVRLPDESLLCTVFGRSARLGEVHVLASGSPCRDLVPALRRLFPSHRVSRADSAVDLSTDFASIDALTLEFATQRGIAWRLVQDAAGGATRYLGAPSSEVRSRLYRKTEQMRALHPDQAHEVPENWVRAEVQVRPGKQAAKEVASTAPAADLWGFAAWSADYSLTMFGVEVQRTPTHFRRNTEWESQLHWLGRQYGPAFRERCEQAGYDVAFRELAAAMGCPAPLPA